jgi:pimeloyl-ACP methyl ester carboxylesterase
MSVDNGEREARDNRTPEGHREITTVDGRTLCYSLCGPEDGARVVFHSGTPGTRFLSRTWIELIERIGVRALVPDRPGYGGSTRQPDRSVDDVATDVAQMADAQGWKTFSTWGASGGGPHALACAARFRQRVTRCAVVTSLAPYNGCGLDWFGGMSPGNIQEFKQALKGEARYRPLVERLSRQAIAQLDQGEPAIPPGYDVPKSDLEEMRRRLAADATGFVERTRRAWVDGIDGWIDDCIAMVRPWGFDVAKISIPVSIWYGQDDVLSPRSHAEWLIANIPGAEGREMTGGHMFSEDYLSEILRWVTA